MRKTTIHKIRHYKTFKTSPYRMFQQVPDSDINYKNMYLQIAKSKKKRIINRVYILTLISKKFDKFLGQNGLQRTKNYQKWGIWFSNNHSESYWSYNESLSSELTCGSRRTSTASGAAINRWRIFSARKHSTCESRASKTSTVLAVVGYWLASIWFSVALLLSDDTTVCKVNYCGDFLFLKNRPTATLWIF